MTIKFHLCVDVRINLGDNTETPHDDFTVVIHEDKLAARIFQHIPISVLIPDDSHGHHVFQFFEAFNRFSFCAMLISLLLTLTNNYSLFLRRNSASPFGASHSFLEKQQKSPQSHFETYSLIRCLFSEKGVIIGLFIRTSPRFTCELKPQNY